MFKIKDYLLDNDYGFYSECDTYKQVFNGVDTRSIETVMRSLKKVEIDLETDEMQEVIRENAVHYDEEMNYYDVTAEIDYEDRDYYTVKVEISETSIDRKAYPPYYCELDLTDKQKENLILDIKDHIEDDLREYKGQMQGRFNPERE